MSSAVIESTRWVVSDHSDRAITDFVERVLMLTQPVRHHERRRDKRTAFPSLLTLTPIGDTSMAVSGEPVTVAGKYLAGRGLDFHHTFPLPFKRAIVSFDDELALDSHFVLNIAWCRFLRPGWYDSGGRFTHIVRCSDDPIPLPNSGLESLD